MSAQKTITVEASIAASVEKVWQLYTDSKHIVQWNTALPAWHTPRAQNDLRVGGKFTFRMEARDKSAGFDFEGTYTAVKTHEFIEYAMADGRKVRVHFSNHAGHTHVTVTFDPEQTNSLELQRNGWQAILNNFKEYVEKTK